MGEEQVEEGSMNPCEVCKRGVGVSSFQSAGSWCITVPDLKED